MEAAPGGVVEPALEIVAVGKRHRMDEEVETAPVLAHRVEGRADVLVRLDVARQDQLGPYGCGQRTDPLLECLPDVGEAQLGPFAMRRLRDAPGDAALVGHTHDQASTARENP